MGTSFKDTLKPFDDFKNKPQKFWSNIFWYVKVNIFWKFIQYTLHYDKTQIKKISFGQNKRYKKFPLSRAPSHNSFTFNSQFLYKLKHMPHLSKTVCGIFHVSIPSRFIKVYIFIHQKHGLFDFTTS